MLRWIGLCLSLLFSVQCTYGISAVATYKVFYSPTENNTLQPYIEVYWQIDPQTVQFAKNEKEYWVGKVATAIEISGSNTVYANDKYYLQTTPAMTLPAAGMQNIIDLNRISVQPGMVKIKLTLSEDGNTGSVYTYIDSVNVSQAQVNTFYSNIQLLDTFYKTPLKEHVLLKNGQVQIPLSADFLDDGRTHLTYYGELYNASSVANAAQPLVQYVSISKKEYDFPVYNLTTTDTIKTLGIYPSLGRFRIDVLPSGNYYLNFVLKNAHGEEIAKRNLFFQRSNVKPVVVKDTTISDTGKVKFENVNVFDLSTTFVGKYTASQLKAILKMLLPIASPIEKDNIISFEKKPDETYMRYFVYNFWKAHTPANPEKGWQDYTKQIKEVIRLFGSSMIPGYETERGMIYLKFGPPEQRFSVSNEEGAVPYEVWQYNAPGKQSSPGAFLFYNPGFMGNDYRLLHSTVIGELRNTSWRDLLYSSGRSANNLNSRAEQAFPNR